MGIGMRACVTCKYNNGVAVVGNKDEPCYSCLTAGDSLPNYEMKEEFKDWKPPKITTADKIRSMTDEQMAEWLARSEFNQLDFFAGELQKHAHITVEYPKDEAKLMEEILKWLKEEVSE